MMNSRLRSLILLVALNSLPFGMSLRQKSLATTSLSSSSCLLCRGGQQQPPPPPPDYNTNPYLQQQQPNFNAPIQESVQDRHDKWRMEQLRQRHERSEAQQADIRDSQGRVKLLASVGRGSRAFIFFLCMWRDIHLFEVADKAIKKSVRSFASVPLTILFTSNLAGVVFSLMGQSGHAAKKRLKAILNLDKMMEIVLMMWYFLRLTVLPSKYVPREIYIASILHSLFFIIQCQAFTRITWDEKLAAPSIPPEESSDQVASQYQDFYQDPQQQRRQEYYDDPRSYPAQTGSNTM